jgi:hypothetical protein
MDSKATSCENRDGYLGRWLTGEEQAEFEAHLTDCPECRHFIHENERLERLLARANAALLPVPADLPERIDRRIHQTRQRRVFAWTTGFAAAGILICAIGAWLHLPRGPGNETSPSPVLTKRPPPSEPRPDPRSLVEVTVEHPSDVIAVPQKTDNPSVTIIWLYPTIQAAQEPTSAPAGLFQPSERNGI